MGSSPLCIIDEGHTPDCDGVRVYWRSWEAPGGHSALAIQSASQKVVREEFLQWVHDFAETPISGTCVRDRLRLPDGFSAWWISRIFERYPTLYDGGLYEIFKLRALELWADGQDIRHIELYSGNPYLRAVIQSWCDASGRTCRMVPEKSVKKHSKRRLSGNFLKILRYVLRWLWKERRLFPFHRKIPRQQGIAIATWFPNYDMGEAFKGRFRSNYWLSLHNLLDAAPVPLHWLLLYIGERKDLSAQIAERNRFTQNMPQSLTFWQECVDIRACLRALRNWRIVAKAALSFDEHIAGLCRWPASRLSIEAYIRPLWEDSTSGIHLMRHLLFREGIEAWLAAIGPQTAVLAPSELQVWERVLYRHARIIGNPRIYATMHSIVGPGAFRFFVAPDTWAIDEFLRQMPDCFLCNGTASTDFMSRGGFPAQRLSLVESLRYQYLADHTVAEYTDPPDTLLVTTTYAAKEVETQIGILAQAIKKGLPEHIRRVVIKAHPAHPVEPHLKRHFPIGGKSETTAIPLSELLVAGTAVYAGNSTTAAVEAAYCGLPVFVQEAVDDFNLSPLAGRPGICFVRTADDLIAALQNPVPASLPEDFFLLDAELPRWKALLNEIFTLPTPPANVPASMTPDQNTLSGPPVSARPIPRVSVIMGVYNAQKHLEEAVRSILEQTFTDFELVVVDNASTDDSVDIVESFNDPRIRLIRNPEDKERCFSRNLAIENTVSDLVAMMDADDQSLPHRLERQVAFMESNPEVTVCGGFFIKYEQNVLGRVPETDAGIRVQLMFDSCLPNPTCVFRKEAVLRAGGYRDEFILCEDYDLWARLSEDAGVRFANIPEPMIRYRTYPGGMRAEHLRLQRERGDRVRLRLARRLAPDMSGSEAAAHLMLTDDYATGDANELSRCRAWVEKLLDANARLKLYDQDIFRDMWLKHWLFLCRRSLSVPLLLRALSHEDGQGLRKALKLALRQKLQNALFPKAWWSKYLHHDSI
jgi:surface carbohydrate biosynthesis protein (TIGR04326 family)